MNHTRRKLGLLLALCMLPVGCNKSKNDAPATSSGAPASAEGKVVKLAFVTNNASQFWKIAEAGLRKCGDELGAPRTRCSAHAAIVTRWIPRTPIPAPACLPP